MEQRVVGAGAAQHLGVEGVGEAHHAAGAGDLLARRWAQTSSTPRSVPGSTRSTRASTRAAGGLLAQQPRLDDAGVVEHQQVARRSRAGRSRNTRSDRHRRRCRRAAARRCVRAPGAGRSARAAARSRSRRGCRLACVSGPGLGRRAFIQPQAGSACQECRTAARRRPPRRAPAQCGAGARDGQAGPGARHRPGAAPAAALRGRDPAGAAGRTRRDGETAQVQGVVRDTRRSRRAPRRQLLVRLHDGSGRADAALPALLPGAAEGAGRRASCCACAARCAAASSAARWCTRRFSAGRRRHAAAAGADAGLPDQRRSCRRPTCARPWPRRWRARRWTSCCRRAPCRAGLPPLREALHAAAPAAARGAPLAALEDRSHPAWQRLKFDELLAQQLSQLTARARSAPRCAHRRCAPPPGGLPARLLAALPFAADAGAAARRATRSRRPGAAAADAPAAAGRRRLRQDGGRGAGRGARAIDAGWQCALMAPTEILAEQHFRKLVQWLEPLGLAHRLAHRQPARQGARAMVGDGRRRARRAGGRHARGDPGRRRASRAWGWRSSTSSTASASRSGWRCARKLRGPGGSSRTC